MTIRVRIIVGFLAAILLISISITGLAAWKMREDALGYFFTSTSQQLKLVSTTVDDFISTAQKNVDFLASSDIAQLGELFPNFKDSTKTSTYRFADMAPDALRAIKNIEAIDKAYEEYVEIYAGYPKGNYATSIDGASVSPHYVTNTRPWYRETEKASSESVLANAYVSMTGTTVFAVTRKMIVNGVLTGVVGIDISLDNLTKIITELNFAKTGYFMLIENTGRILCDPKNVANNGKIIPKLFKIV